MDTATALDQLNKAREALATAELDELAASDAMKGAVNTYSDARSEVARARRLVDAAVQRYERAKSEERAASAR
jgi:hypothetical protein